MKKITLLILLLLTIHFGYGQTMLAQFDFENPGGYITNDIEFTDGARDYFLRTDGSNITGENFTNTQGSYYFAAQDTYDTSLVLPLTLLIDNINISGYSNIEFRVHLAEDDAVTSGGTVFHHWDNGDYVHFNYDIDNSGSLSNLLWIENDGGGGNREPLIDTDFDGVGDGTAITDTFTQFTQNIAGTGSLLDIEIEFRLNAGNEDIAIDNIEIWGTLIPCGTSVTWNGASWVGGTPDLTTNVIIDGNYNTNTNGNFSACSLTINSGFRLTVDDGDDVEVQNDVTVDGELFVETQGNFVQKNDAAIFTDNSTNGVQLTKSKNMYRQLAYTYWSSPVANETIEQVFGNTPGDRRYFFNAANFVDTQIEIGNTNTFTPGQDDIDDNGDDWQLASGAMQPGTGYAAVASLFGPAFPRIEDFIFGGEFNNGVIQSTLINNSGGVYNDWNFIGNPYPGAISVDQFFTVNTGLVGVIYLWDQATPQGNTGGSGFDNFSVDDYAMINGTMEVGARANTGTIPNRFIASGQGFFVEALNAGNVTFNNSMRSSGADNSQFFKDSNTKKKSTNNTDKLWVNLTSDNGVSNQIGIGYVNGATKSDDGAFYDAVKNFSAGAYASLYSIIENSDKKFAIQGKAPSDLNENEIIDLGFKTSIDVETLYTLSIAQLEGDYLNNNTVYLKDNLLDKLHNLSDSDYTFTSEVGEFNTRFQILFTDKALSTNDIDLNDNRLTIIELDNNHVNFKTSNSLAIKTVTIYDLLGRELYNLKGETSSETYELSNLNSTIYITKVELSNGEIITKKAIKR